MKNLTTLLLLVVSLFCFSQNLEAQSKKFEDVLSVELRNIGTIKDGGKVSGYYLFYKTDKGRKGMSEFELQVMDTELNVVFTKKMTEVKTTVLSSAVSNGEVLLFKFWQGNSPRERKIKFAGYNYKGEKVVTKSYTISDRKELAMYQQQGAFLNVFGTAAIPGYGFVEFFPKKYDKWSYEMKFIPHRKGARAWSKKGSTKEYQTAQHLCTVDSILINIVNSRPRTMSAKEIKFMVQGINARTGKTLFTKDLLAENYNTLILNGAPSPDNKNIVLYGLYYPDGEKITKKSKGLIKIVMDVNGKIIEDFKLPWTRGFNVKNGDDNDFGNMHIHEFVYGEDGKTYMIAEQFGLNAGRSLLNGALSSMSGGSVNAGGTAYNIRDLLVIELTKDFKVEDIEVIEKSRNTYSSIGIPFGSSQSIGMLLDYYGWFDFSYLQKKNRPGEFTIGYVNFEKIKGEKNKLVFGGVTRTDGEYAYDKIPLSVKGAEVKILEGKPGYICLMEYTKKTKSLDLRLEKINF